MTGPLCQSRLYPIWRGLEADPGAQWRAWSPRVPLVLGNVRRKAGGWWGEGGSQCCGGACLKREDGAASSASCGKRVGWHPSSVRPSPLALQCAHPSEIFGIISK